MSKQYGLILPGQQKKKPIAPLANVRPTIFDESSSDSNDDESSSKLKPIGQQKVTSGPSMVERRMARRVHEQALAEDPTIFQYDEVYDDMEMQRDDEKQMKRNEPRKAKYIGRLMEHAERRKMEHEMRLERQVQKEREAEGETFKDKDTYVTSSYRKRLEELRKLQEKDEREEYLEAIGDVTKQKDLDGFYRHLYEQKTGTGDKTIIKPDIPKTFADSGENYAPIKSIDKQQRAYRKRRTSNDSAKSGASDDESSKNRTNANKKVHLHNNIDADSDFSIDSSDSEDEKRKASNNQQATKKEIEETEKEPITISNIDESKKLIENKTTDEDDQLVPIKIKPKYDKEVVWGKRTVGDVFDAALQRYFERKARKA